MAYILGLVGHPDINSEVKKIILSHFDNIETIELPVVDDRDVEHIKLKMPGYEKKCMGMLFTAEDIYHLFNNRMQIKVNSSFLEQKKSELLKALFIAGRNSEMNCDNISIDSVSYEMMKDIYEDLGFAEHENYQILTIPFNVTEVDSIYKITASHKENHSRFGSTCITFFTETKNQLEKLDIPVLKVGIDKEEVIQKVNEFIARRYKLPDKSRNRVAIIIKLGDLKEHLILNNSEHNVVTEFNRISEAVFWFAEKIDGAYIPNDQRKYIIFCDKEPYEKATKSSVKIDILNEITRNEYFSCSIGIGYGENDREAVKNATIAQIKAVKEGKNSAFVIYGKNKILGPILSFSEYNANRKTIYNVILNEIASRSQISINTMYKLYNIVKKSNETDFSSRDISDYLGITIRSTNRLFEKLLKSGYIRIIGEKSNGEKGRPSRIYRFLF